ncbi:hypothetical protein MSIBF_A3820006 [groundwater metagenome]|uniref:Uncharacterized protein n=1 Tax=groundwater metagenome TaxID=717931 RepID=A0A098ECZ1_9ZZZZ
MPVMSELQKQMLQQEILLPIMLRIPTDRWLKLMEKTERRRNFIIFQRFCGFLKKRTFLLKIYLPERTAAGVCELVCKNLKENTIIQFETFGFCRVDKIKGDMIEFYFTQR